MLLSRRALGKKLKYIAFPGLPLRQSKYPSRHCGSPEQAELGTENNTRSGQPRLGYDGDSLACEPSRSMIAVLVHAKPHRIGEALSN